MKKPEIKTFASKLATKKTFKIADITQTSEVFSSPDEPNCSSGYHLMIYLQNFEKPHCYTRPGHPQYLIRRSEVPENLSQVQDQRQTALKVGTAMLCLFCAQKQNIIFSFSPSPCASSCWPFIPLPLHLPTAHLFGTYSLPQQCPTFRRP